MKIARLCLLLGTVDLSACFSATPSATPNKPDGEEFAAVEDAFTIPLFDAGAPAAVARGMAVLKNATALAPGRYVEVTFAPSGKTRPLGTPRMPTVFGELEWLEYLVKGGMRIRLEAAETSKLELLENQLRKLMATTPEQRATLLAPLLEDIKGFLWGPQGDQAVPPTPTQARALAEGDRRLQSGSIDATVRIYSVGMTKVQGVTARLSSADPGHDAGACVDGNKYTYCGTLRRVCSVVVNKKSRRRRDFSDGGYLGTKEFSESGDVWLSGAWENEPCALKLSADCAAVTIADEDTSDAGNNRNHGENLDFTYSSGQLQYFSSDTYARRRRRRGPSNTDVCEDSQRMWADVKPVDAGSWIELTFPPAKIAMVRIYNRQDGGAQPGRLGRFTIDYMVASGSWAGTWQTCATAGMQVAGPMDVACAPSDPLQKVRIRQELAEYLEIGEIELLAPAEAIEDTPLGGASALFISTDVLDAAIRNTLNRVDAETAVAAINKKIAPGYTLEMDNWLADDDGNFMTVNGRLHVLRPSDDLFRIQLIPMADNVIKLRVDQINVGLTINIEFSDEQAVKLALSALLLNPVVVALTMGLSWILWFWLMQFASGITIEGSLSDLAFELSFTFVKKAGGGYDAKIFDGWASMPIYDFEMSGMPFGWEQGLYENQIQPMLESKFGPMMEGMAQSMFNEVLEGWAFSTIPFTWGTSWGTVPSADLLLDMKPTKVSSQVQGDGSSYLGYAMLSEVRPADPAYPRYGKPIPPLPDNPYSAGGAPITVTSATYGGNAGAAYHNNQKQNLARACDGKSVCSYKVDHTVIGDPVSGVAKTYTYSWTCGRGAAQSGTVGAEASGQTIVLECPGSAYGSAFGGPDAQLAPSLLMMMFSDWTFSTAVHSMYVTGMLGVPVGSLSTNLVQNVCDLLKPPEIPKPCTPKKNCPKPVPLETDPCKMSDGSDNQAMKNDIACKYGENLPVEIEVKMAPGTNPDYPGHGDFDLAFADEQISLTMGIVAEFKVAGELVMSFSIRLEGAVELGMSWLGEDGVAGGSAEANPSPDAQIDCNVGYTWETVPYCDSQEYCPAGGCGCCVQQGTPPAACPAGRTVTGSVINGAGQPQDICGGKHDNPTCTDYSWETVPYCGENGSPEGGPCCVMREASYQAEVLHHVSTCGQCGYPMCDSAHWAKNGDVEAGRSVGSPLSTWGCGNFEREKHVEHHSPSGTVYAVERMGKCPAGRFESGSTVSRPDGNSQAVCTNAERGGWTDVASSFAIAPPGMPAAEECPSGFVPIFDRGECATAGMSLLGKPLSDHVNPEWSTHRPKGCFLHASGGGTVYHSPYDPDPGYVSAGDNQVICKRPTESYTYMEGYYVAEGHGKCDWGTHRDLATIQNMCTNTPDCTAVAKQDNLCDGQYRLVKGGPTFIFYGDWKTYNLWSFRRNPAPPSPPPGGTNPPRSVADLCKESSRPVLYGEVTTLKVLEVVAKDITFKCASYKTASRVYLLTTGDKLSEDYDGLLMDYLISPALAAAQAAANKVLKHGIVLPSVSCANLASQQLHLSFTDHFFAVGVGALEPPAAAGVQRVCLTRAYNLQKNTFKDAGGDAEYFAVTNMAGIGCKSSLINCPDCNAGSEVIFADGHDCCEANGRLRPGSFITLGLYEDDTGAFGNDDDFGGEGTYTIPQDIFAQRTHTQSIAAAGQGQQCTCPDGTTYTVNFGECKGGIGGSAFGGAPGLRVYCGTDALVRIDYKGFAQPYILSHVNLYNGDNEYGGKLEFRVEYMLPRPEQVAPEPPGSLSGALRICMSSLMKPANREVGNEEYFVDVLTSSPLSSSNNRRRGGGFDYEIDHNDKGKYWPTIASSGIAHDGPAAYWDSVPGCFGDGREDDDVNTLPCGCTTMSRTTSMQALYLRVLEWDQGDHDAWGYALIQTPAVYTGTKPWYMTQPLAAQSKGEASITFTLEFAPSVAELGSKPWSSVCGYENVAETSCNKCKGTIYYGRRYDNANKEVTTVEEMAALSPLKGATTEQYQDNGACEDSGNCGYMRSRVFGGFIPYKSACSNDMMGGDPASGHVKQCMCVWMSKWS